jgi:hypothetical protein
VARRQKSRKNGIRPGDALEASKLLQAGSPDYPVRGIAETRNHNVLIIFRPIWNGFNSAWIARCYAK